MAPTPGGGPCRPGKYQMKVSSDGGGISHNRPLIKRPTRNELLYNAELALYVNSRDGKVNIHKNRFGPTGEVSTKDLIDIVTRILVRQIFGNRMLVFRAGMRLRLKRAINKIVKEGA